MSASTFGRWCFAAGWILAAVLSGAYRLLDWPDWFGAAIALLVSCGMFRLVDWAARQLDTSTTTEHHVK